MRVGETSSFLMLARIAAAGVVQQLIAVPETRRGLF